MQHNSFSMTNDKTITSRLILLSVRILNNFKLLSPHWSVKLYLFTFYVEKLPQ